MPQTLFDAVCDCRACPSPDQVFRSPEQPPEPWLGQPTQPAWVIGLDPAHLRETMPETGLIRHTYATGKQMLMGYAQYRSLCETNPYKAERFFENLYRMLPAQLQGQLFATNLVRCRRAEGRRELTKATMRSCFEQHLRPLLSQFRPKLILVYGKQTRDFLLEEWIVPTFKLDPAQLEADLSLGHNETEPKIHLISEHQAVVFIQHPTVRRFSDEEANAHRAALKVVCEYLNI